MFRHHEQDHLSEAEREKLLAEGKKAKAMVWSTTPVDGQPGVSRLRFNAHFPDGQVMQFDEDLQSLYQPAPDSPDGIRIRELRQRLQLKHADHIPKLQLATAAGSDVTVRYDESDHKRIVVDLPSLQHKAVEAYIADMTKPKRGTVEAAPTGPPWEVPDHCPNCGAPIDVAVAANAKDPQCRFCEQPIPVKPLAHR